MLPKLLFPIILIALAAVFFFRPANMDLYDKGSGDLLWVQGDERWEPKGEVPACPDPIIFRPPVDISKATNILYPGQFRTGGYKPHGGFRFEGSGINEIEVVAPMDGYLIRGARYFSMGQIQYVFDFINNCGFMWRLGHMATLTPRFEEIASRFPEPKVDDSRDTRVTPPVFVAEGEKIATGTGLIVDGHVNTFLDWGVYDLRRTNKSWESAEYRKKVGADTWREEIVGHAVCWFDMLPAEDAARVKSLPATDPTSGNQSDYCE